MQTKGYLFDYGGTLDTAGNHWGMTLRHAYERCAIPVSEADFREAYVFAERTLGKQHIIKPDDTFRHTLEVKIALEMGFLEKNGLLMVGTFERARLVSQMLAEVYPRVQEQTARSREVLLRLKEQSRLVLVSNFYGNLQRVLEEFRLNDLFCDVVESAAVGIRKPDEGIYRLALQRLGLEATDVTVVGDSLKNDIRPAHALGMHTVWLRGEGWTPQPAEDPAAERIISNLGEL